ncbi:lantibiotic dehydratase [Actinoplanes flavus]|uniref:Lantibiotic dehydratase n=1 Tax=Actinoplanes flavus TaxID=2820290 RepID=A0ABS3UH55_9ACTN|nr:lantibiotic dehydratase [Actinoplanes flavus]MBO3738110.1 lantibiotic dehydratase [Actinoplanes flavus]
MAGSSSEPNSETWSAVPAVLLRSTGLPFEMLADLSTPGLHDRFTRLAGKRARVRRLQAEFATTVFPAVVANEEASGADRAVFRAWFRARRQVERGRPADDVPSGHHSPEAVRWLAGWAELLAEVAAGHAELVREHTAAVDTALNGIGQVAGDERFADAVFLSSPSMYQALRRYSRRTAVRKVDLQLWSYLQRFTTKNDTMSLYGPVDHGVVDPDPAAPPLVLTTGERPPVRLTRTAYWAAQALAETIAADPEIRPHLIPRLADGLSYDPVTGTLDNTLSGRTVRLSPTDSRIFAAVQQNQRPGPETTERVEALVARRRLTLAPRIPTAEPHPMAWLHRWLTALPVQAGRWRRVIEEQLDIAARFADVPPAEKAVLLDAAERSFTAATGRPARRAEGELYADRTLLFDEAHGDITCRIGPALMDDLGRRLAPALRLCAAYSLVVQDVCRQRARAVLAELGGRSPYLRFVDRLRRSTDIAECLAAPEVQGFLSALYKVVESRTEAGVSVLNADDVAALAVPVPAGTVVSPDLFLAAESLDALHAGDFDVIIGEVHQGVQVWTHLTAFWPDPDGLAASLTDLLGGPDRVAFVHARRQGKAFPLELPGYSAEFGGRSTKEPSEVLGVADLEVTDDGSGPVLWSRKLGRIVQPHAGDPRSIVNWIFGPPPVGAPPPPDAASTPRLRVGHAVLWRRGWTVPGAELATARAATVPTDAQLLVTEVWRDRGLPQRGFARFPGERKPVYVDIGDPLSTAQLLARTTGASFLRVSEMLPEPGHWWLPAAGSGRRSCEWRTTWVAGHG